MEYYFGIKRNEENHPWMNFESIMLCDRNQLKNAYCFIPFI